MKLWELQKILGERLTRVREIWWCKGLQRQIQKRLHKCMYIQGWGTASWGQRTFFFGPRLCHTMRMIRKSNRGQEALCSLCSSVEKMEQDIYLNVDILKITIWKTRKLLTSLIETKIENKLCSIKLHEGRDYAFMTS